MNCKFIIFLLVFWFNSCQYCSAQMVCNGVLTGTINNGVVCAGGSICTLDGATVNGNVECNSGSLLAEGDSLITGNVLLGGQVTRAELDFVMVLGTVQVTDTSTLNELIINEMANLGSVTVDNAPNTEVRVNGTLQGLDLNNAGNLIANNLMTNATVSVIDGNGLIELCGSFLGGLLVEQHTGNIEINANAPNCGPTTINTGLIANKGSGQVNVIGAFLPNGDFSVSEYAGAIILQDIPSVSDIKSEKNTGSLTINNVVVDSDTIITEQTGEITLQGFNVTGDLSITKVDNSITIEELNSNGDFIATEIDGSVVLQDSMFALEQVSILFATGTVRILRNSDFSLTVENISGELRVIENTVANGNINKNTGGVVINNNDFTTLSCTDNSPAPTGSGNTITFGDGQCSSGL